jgi:hypothetical protein
MLSEQIRRLRSGPGAESGGAGPRLGVSKQSISNWENNNIQPSVSCWSGWPTCSASPPTSFWAAPAGW